MVTVKFMNVVLAEPFCPLPRRIGLLKERPVNGCPSQVPTISQRKQQRLGSLPALVVMSKQILQKKKEASATYI